MKLTVSVTEARFGTPQPQLTVEFGKDISNRAKDAVIYALAAEVSVVTQLHERWIVQPDTEKSRVYLELSTGSISETERARSVLAQVAQVPHHHQLLTVLEKRTGDSLTSVSITP